MATSFDCYDDPGYHQRVVDVGDDERQRVKDAAKGGRAARDRSADDGRSATCLLAGVGKGLREAHAHAGVERRRDADE